MSDRGSRARKCLSPGSTQSLPVSVRVLVRLCIVVRMRVVVGPVLPLVRMIVHMGVVLVIVGVLVLVQVIVRVGVRMLMCMGFVSMLVLMSMHVSVLMAVNVFVLMCSFHDGFPPFVSSWFMNRVSTL